MDVDVEVGDRVNVGGMGVGVRFFTTSVSSIGIGVHGFPAGSAHCA